MLNFSRSLQIKIFKFINIATIILCFGLTLFITSKERICPSYFLSIEIKIKHFLLFFILLLVWHLIFLYCGLYKSRRIGSKFQECMDILKCNSLGSLAILFVGMIFQIELFSILFIKVFWLNINLIMISERIILRYALASLRIRGKDQRLMIIVGTGERAQKLVNLLQEKKELGYRIIGFIDDKFDNSKNLICNYPLLGNIKEFFKILNDYIVDEVVIALPIKSYYSEIGEILNHCENQGIIVRLLYDIFTVRLAKLKLDFLDEVPLLTFYSSPSIDSRMMAKRAMDILVSFILLIVFSPLFLFVIILTKSTTRGTVFFIQDRLGYNKRIFKIIKFRTMVENAEELLPSLEHLNEMDGPTFKIKNDPRLTRFGKILRKTSIDELPQLINVLKGDISLVGPRPLPVRDYMGFDEDWQKRRFSVKPGLTCLWQIEGRNEISFSKWMELDMEYIDHWSLWLDFKIILKTIPIVIMRKGAM